MRAGPTPAKRHRPFRSPDPISAVLMPFVITSASSCPGRGAKRHAKSNSRVRWATPEEMTSCSEIRL